MAKKGDDVVVCARANDFVLAYNQRNNTAGRIPSAHLVWKGDNTFIQSWIFLTLGDRKGDLAQGGLSWEIGQHVRVYTWDDEMRRDSGIGLNMATKEIGRFRTNPALVRILDSF